MMKRIMAMAFVLAITISLSTVVTHADLVEPTTVTEALKDANDALGYNYFSDSNLYHRLPINSKLAKNIWGTYKDRISGAIYHGNEGVDFGYTLAYGSASQFISGVPDIIGETMSGEDFYNIYAPMDSWDTRKKLEERAWIEEPWYDAHTLNRATDWQFDALNIYPSDLYRDNIVNGLSVFYSDILDGRYKTIAWENYVHVLQPPTKNGFGVGVMWHQSGGKVWYLTVPIAPDEFPVSSTAPTPSPTPTLTPIPAAAPTGTIKFVPDSCNWRNTDLQVKVYVDGNTTTTVNSVDSRTYKYSVFTCTESVHDHHSGCYDEQGVLTCIVDEHDHDSSCYSDYTSSTPWRYSQNWSIDKIHVSGTPPISASTNINNNTNITLSQTGADELTAKLTGWNSGSASWNAGSPPQGSWDSRDTPAGTAAPTENYESTSGTYRIDKINPTITFDWANQDEFKLGRHWFVYLPGNRINLTLGDNLSGIAESRYTWSQDAAFSASVAGMTSLGRTTTEGANATITTAIPVHDTQDRVKSWYLHVYARDRAGNEFRTSQPVYIECSLQNFRIMDITDRQWESVFWNPDYASGVSTGAYYPVSTMPVDRHPTKNSITRMGYAFYFTMTSRGLNGDVDTVQIKPRFYYMKDLKNDSIRNAFEVDLYYDLDREYLIQYGSSRDHFTMTYDRFSIGVLSQLTLNNDVRTITDTKNSTWNGRFALIPTTKAVRKGLPIVVNGKVDQAVLLTKGLIMVNFTIEGFKNGTKVFDYNPDQWTTEGGPKDSTLFYTGDTLIFDLTNSSLDDYGAGTDR
jgi:hypothetical protein